MPDAVPEWCEVKRGTSAVLLVAPHGGRRPPIDPCAPPANLRVNDVYTPEVTRALGERLGAGWVINRGLDRNELDLNRLSQVRRRAPWFLELLAREIEAVVARHGRAEVLFIHGWNNGQLKCDIGLGGCERDGVIESPTGGALTVSAAYLDGRVRSFRAACEAAGISAPIGEKYPASHPNNVVQLFSNLTGSDHSAACQRIATLARQGSLAALQLELTLPLRCPGAWRERFIECTARAFGDTCAPCLEARPALSATAETPLGGSESLQFYDAGADLGLFAGIGRMSPRSVGGRLLLFLGGQRIALFTGEEVGESAVPPLRIWRDERGLELRFAGPILVIEDAAEYLDLEAALAASSTVEAEVNITFEEASRASGFASFGRVYGKVTVGGRRHALETSGFGRVAGLRSAGAAQTMLAATFGAQRAFVGRVVPGEVSSAVQFEDGAPSPVRRPELEVIAGGDEFTPRAFELRAEALPPLRAEALSRMAILRSASHGYVRVAFGVARYSWDGLEGHGLYEHALPLPAVRPA